MFILHSNIMCSYVKNLKPINEKGFLSHEMRDFASSFHTQTKMFGLRFYQKYRGTTGLLAGTNNKRHFLIWTNPQSLLIPILVQFHEKIMSTHETQKLSVRQIKLSNCLPPISSVIFGSENFQHRLSSAVFSILGFLQVSFVTMNGVVDVRFLIIRNLSY